MGKLEFRNPDELELDVGRVLTGTSRHSRTETLPHELRSYADETTQIEEKGDSVRTRSRVQEKGLDQTDLLSKYARVLCCSFELESGN